MIDRSTLNAPRPVVVCPLEFERRALLSAGLNQRCEVICCGPGPTRVASWVKALGDSVQPIILAGLAGALVEHARAGSAWIIDEVIDAESDRRWRPTFVPPIRAQGFQRAGVAITSSTTGIASREIKVELHRRTGAALVDLESVAFARAATDEGLRWAIVRGVSDGLGESLPNGVESWVDESGRSRLLTVFGAIIRRPMTLQSVLRLRRQGLIAMRATGNVIRGALEKEAAELD